jgi:type IV pilus assembly protein PilE
VTGSRLRYGHACSASRTHATIFTGERGFTLIEALVTAAIIAILAAIAIPSYRDQVLKAHRAEGQVLLLEIAARQERFYLDNKRYTADMTQLGFGSDPVISPEGHYSLDATAGATGNIATSFLATATRRGGQADDTRCGDFTVDSTGATSVVNYAGYDQDTPPAPPTRCW